MDAFAPRGSTPDTTKPRFHMRAVEMPFKSREAGRPIFEDHEFVEIITPGRNKSVAVEPVNEQHRQRWPREYDGFKRGLELPVTGTPLEEWSALTGATVANLKAMNMRTVEDLAGASDGVLQDVGPGGFDLRRRAQAFLEQAAGSAPLERALQEIEHLKARNEVLEGQVRDLAALIEDEGEEDGGSRRRGRHTRAG